MIRYLPFLLFLMACGTTQKPKDLNWRTGIMDVLQTQQVAWNNGNIEAFMEGYWKSDSLSFSGSNGRTLGWQKTLARYKSSYPDKDAMGQLAFEVLDLDLLGPESAVMLGRYTLIRVKDRPTGLFTLIWRKINGKWVIVSDHTC